MDCLNIYVVYIVYIYNVQYLKSIEYSAAEMNYSQLLGTVSLHLYILVPYYSHNFSTKPRMMYIFN